MALVYDIKILRDCIVFAAKQFFVCFLENWRQIQIFSGLLGTSLPSKEWCSKRSSATLKLIYDYVGSWSSSWKSREDYLSTGAHIIVYFLHMYLIWPLFKSKFWKVSNQLTTKLEFLNFFVYWRLQQNKTPYRRQIGKNLNKFTLIFLHFKNLCFC